MYYKLQNYSYNQKTIYSKMDYQFHQEGVVDEELP